MKKFFLAGIILLIVLSGCAQRVATLPPPEPGQPVIESDAGRKPTVYEVVDSVPQPEAPEGGGTVPLPAIAEKSVDEQLTELGVDASDSLGQSLEDIESVRKLGKQ